MLNRYPSAPSVEAKKPRQSNTTADPLVLPITPAELAEFMALDYSASDDAMLNSFIAAACESFIAYASHELLERQWVLNWSSHPQKQIGIGGLSPTKGIYTWRIDLPLTPVASVDTVTVEGDPAEYTARISDKPASIELNETGEIEITYTAGYATAADIPQGILQGIMLLASAMYSSRGTCDLCDLLCHSGAKALWGRYMMVRSI